MSAIKVDLDGLDSSAVQIKSVALTLNDLKSLMNRVFSSVDPKIKHRRNIDRSIADIQKNMETMYTEINELSNFITSSKNQYANTETHLVQVSNDYTDRINNILNASADVGACVGEGILPGEKIEEKSESGSWLERIGNAVIGKAKSVLKQLGDLIVNVGFKIISGTEGMAVSSVLNYVEGFANVGFGIAETFHLVPGTTARYEFKHDLDALQATIADKYVLDKKWYYGGRSVGDIMSSIVGTKIAAQGVAMVVGGIVVTAGGAGISATGAGAVIGVPAIAVSEAAVAVGVLVTATGVSISAVSAKNFNDDFSKFQQEGQAETRAGETPDYIKDNRVPLDKETVLSGKEYKKTNIKVKGAQVYKNGDNYYYRDTFHTGASSHLEVFDKWGNHIGEANPRTGDLIPGTADPIKKINIK